MNWRSLSVAPCGTHHLGPDGSPVYPQRFDEVLKFHQPGLAPVKKGEHAWHIDGDGSPAYPRKFQRTFGFYEGRAAVQNPNGWHHILPDGSPLYSKYFAWAGNFQGGRCPVRRQDGSYVHIDRSGGPVYTKSWKYAGDYRDGIAVVQDSNGYSTHIDAAGELVHGQWFVDLDVYHKGFARAAGAEGWFHVDKKGTALYAQRFATVEPFYNGQARVQRFNGALEVIDEAGRTVTALRAPLRSEFAQLSSDMVGFWRTQTIAAAVDLGILEALPANTLEVARTCGTKADETGRLLKALAELSLVSVVGQQWRPTSRGQYLLRDHPLTLADASLEYAKFFSSTWQDLPEALAKAGKWQKPDVFGDVGRDPKRCAGHHRMLQSYARHDYPAVAEALPFAEVEHVIDAGGGLGTLAKLLVKRFSRLRTTVLDRPEVVALGKSGEGHPRLAWHPGNLFEAWSVSGDAVVLARVLHDWDDDLAVKILRRAREALGIGGRVFVVEMMLDESSAAGALCDLHLLMASDGQERTAEHYRTLLRKAGFEPTGIQTLATLPSILESIAI